MKTFEVTNMGSMSTSALAVTLTGDSDFTMDASACADKVLDVGRSCQLSLTFSTATTSLKHGTVTISANEGGSASLALEGSGLAPSALAATPPALDFAPLVVGQSAMLSVSIKNTGDLTTSDLHAAITPTGSFTIKSDTCSGTSLAGQGMCTLSIGFSPLIAGARNATLSVGDGTLAANVGLSGTGLAPGVLSIESGASFAQVKIPSTSMASVTVKNTGGATLTNLTTSIVPSGTEFSVISDGCAQQNLGAGATCVIALRFSPLTSGTKTATLSVGAASASPATTPLSAIASAHITVVLARSWCDGMVTSTNGAIKCGTAPNLICDADITGDLILTPAAMNQPNRPCYFDGWSEFGCSGKGTCTVSMATDRTYHAAFSPKACVDPANGNNSFAGTCTKPFKTIGKALTLGPFTSEVIQLKPGLYSTTASGEAFPIQVPGGVSLIGNEATLGDGANPTEVQGNPQSANSGTFVVASVASVTIAGLKISIDTAVGGSGVLATSSNGITLRNNTIVASTSGSFSTSGVALSQCRACSVSYCTLSGLGTGIDAEDSDLLRVDHSVIRSNSLFGVAIRSTSSSQDLDLGGGASTGDNVLSCNSFGDLSFTFQNGAPTLTARHNSWDHPTPTQGPCPTGTALDICSDVAVDAQDPLPAASNPCPDPPP